MIIDNTNRNGIIEIVELFSVQKEVVKNILACKSSRDFRACPAVVVF